MWDLDYKESWVPKNWCFWTVVLEKTFESLLDCKEIQPVHPKDRSWVFVHWKDWCWSWNSNTWATWCEELTHWKKTLMLGKIEGRRRRGDRGWDGWMASPTQWTWVLVTLGFVDRQGCLAYCSSWGHKESVTAMQLNWTELNWTSF